MLCARDISRMNTDTLLIKVSDEEDLRNLFSLDSNGVTMQSIGKEAFTSAVANLSAEQQQLAYGYYGAINSSDVHTVEMVNRSESLSANGVRLTGYTTGAGVDGGAGGGVNGSFGSGSYTIVVMNSTASIPDYRSGDGYTSRNSSAGELLAHELLGHGVGRTKGTSTYRHEDAIQMTNLYLRAQGITNVYRDGRSHGSRVVLSKSTATSIPSFVQIPITLQMNIRRKGPIELKPYIMHQDNTRVDPSYLGRP